MKVFVSPTVHTKIEEFYKAAMNNHLFLEESVVRNKMNRLYASMEAIGDFPYAYPKARVKTDWKNKGYREFICEDFHFAYKVIRSKSREPFVAIYDAEYSALNY